MSLPEPSDKIFKLDGYRMHDCGGRVGVWLAKGAPYEHQLLYQIKELDLGGTVFDVGAHVGNHTIYLAAHGYKVQAWEPHEPSREILMSNLELNPHLADNIVVHEWAAGDRLTHGRFTKGMWLEFDPTRGGANMKLERGDIPVMPIDGKVQVDDLTVVKVDVEGMEPHVLRGMVDLLSEFRPIVYAETHSQEKEQEIRTILKPLGYSRTEIIEMGSPMHRWDA